MRQVTGYLLALAVGGCSSGSNPESAVCDPLAAPLAEVAYPTDPSEGTLADVAERLVSDADGTTRTAMIYLDVAVSADPSPLFDLIRGVNGEEGTVFATQHDSLEQYRLAFGETSPEIVNAITSAALPAWARIHSSNPALVDQTLEAVRTSGLPIYEIVESTDPQPGDSLFIRADDALASLSEQDENLNVATAAAALLAVNPGDGGMLSPIPGLEQHYRMVAQAAEECGLAD